MTADRKRQTGWIATGAIGSLLLLWVAFANGYPLLFSDSGTYLRIGTELYYPLDRSPTYGLLIAPFARLGDLWGIILLQAAFATTIILLTVHAVAGHAGWTTSLAIMPLLAALTSLPWFVGQVMPDLFTSLMALTVFLILFDESRSRLRAWLLPMVLAGLVSVHLSNLPLALGLILVGSAAAVMLGRGRIVLGRAMRAGAGVLLAAASLSAMNLIVEHQFRPSLASNMFLVARMFDARVGQPILTQACGRSDMRLCAAAPFVDDPQRALPGQDYLWHRDSPRSRMAKDDLARLDAEEAALVRIAFAEHRGAILRSAVEGGAQQLLRARTGDGMARYSDQMQVAQQVRRHFPHEVRAWEGSLQQAGRLQRLATSADQWVAVLAALLAPLILIFAYRQRDRSLFGLNCIVLATIFGNAAICGALSGPADRYQSRVLWLLPLIGMLALAQWLGKQKRMPAR